MAEGRMLQLFLSGGILFLFALLMIVVNWRDGGFVLVLAGFRKGAAVFLENFVVFAFAFLLVGQVQVWMSHHEELIRVRLSGWMAGDRGVVTAFFVAAFTPSVWAVYPFISAFWQQGVGRLASMMFLVSLPLTNIFVIPWQVPFLGWSITLFARAVSLAIALVLLVVFLAISRFVR